MTQFASIHRLAAAIRGNINQVIVGKEREIDRLTAAVLCSGHVLLEDVPGVGKTMLVKALAKSIQCTFKRIQFTPDLLPSDLTGIHYYHQQSGEFLFRPGPLFSNVVLADEINRATPRTQSSLLECMEERQITLDGETRKLSSPFIVIATQNPIEYQGTFPLPEAQLDRFFIKMSLGYPTSDELVDILQRFKETDPLESIGHVVEAEEVVEAQRQIRLVHVSEDILKYMAAIIEQTRQHPDVAIGVSPRGGQALLKAIQAGAVLSGRDYAVPDDVKQWAEPVLSHRLVLKNKYKAKDNAASEVLAQILSKVAVPQEQMARG